MRTLVTDYFDTRAVLTSLVRIGIPIHEATGILSPQAFDLLAPGSMPGHTLRPTRWALIATAAVFVVIALIVVVGVARTQ